MEERRHRNRSAACGAWEHMDGTHAHNFCTGAVNLPPPDDRCTCPCHGPDIADHDPLDDEAHIERARRPWRLHH